jgi:hypothetical protein
METGLAMAVAAGVAVLVGQGVACVERRVSGPLVVNYSVVCGGTVYDRFSSTAPCVVVRGGGSNWVMFGEWGESMKMK